MPLKRPVVSFVVLTNILFIPLFLLVGLTIMLGLPQIFFDVALCIASWASTFAFLILFKRIYPGQRIGTYIKSKFSEKIDGRVVMGIVLIQVVIFLIVVYMTRETKQVDAPLLSVSSVGMLGYMFVKNLFAGPLGEELGWRGFAGQALQQKYSALKSAVIVGFWWGLWHLPIWFTTGFTGMALLRYIGLFMVSIIAVSIVMTACYNLNKNLVIPIIIHQLFNFFIGLINGEILVIIGYYAVLYSVVALGLILLNPKGCLYGTYQRD
ncbi:MAG: lysostaphin resistance A-like protein [Cellulosilyticaceae bacterium]